MVRTWRSAGQGHEAITAARQAGAIGMLVVRANSAFYSATFVAGCQRAGARFSVTTPVDEEH